MIIVNESENWVVFECKASELSLFERKYPRMSDNSQIGKFRVRVKKSNFDQKELNKWLGFERKEVVSHSHYGD